ncbi:MAG: RluA family pseudouridine synthase [Gammaproteobacteria bacterium]|nr:RluA family pseudouridine synthase [Gammaproteobacteria bacterium]
MSDLTSNIPKKISYRTLIVPEERADQRLDNFLIAKLRVPKSLIYNLLRRGKIRVNTRKADPSYRLIAEDAVVVPDQYFETDTKPTISVEKSGWILDYIVDENNDFIIFNKPSGLATHGGSGHSFGLIELIRAARPQQSFELVHRLDRETSGLIVVAKKRSVLRELNAQFADRAVDKIYLTILSQHCRRKENIEAPLSAKRQNNIRISVPDHANGSMAKTSFIPLSRHLGHTLCLVIPETGRMHQIRAHAAYMDNPILGDTLYKGAQDPHFYLHAAQLSFSVKGQTYVYQQEPPQFWDQAFFKGWDLWKVINKHTIKH